MRRLVLSVCVVGGLMVLYGVSPVMAWLALVGSAAFVFARRMRETDAEPAHADR